MVYIFLMVVFFALQSRADCEAQPESIQVDPKIPALAQKLNVQKYCSEFKTYVGPSLQTDELRPKFEALLKVTHTQNSLEQIAEQINEARKGGQLLGLSGLKSEGNAFLVKDRAGKVELISVKHVADSDVLGKHLAVFRTERFPFQFSANGVARVSQDVIEVDDKSIQRSTSLDIAIIASPRLMAFKEQALEARSVDEPLLLNEPVVLAGYQDEELKTFSCEFRGYGAEAFKHGVVEPLLKCDNDTILLGGISGGVVIDRMGRAVAAFNGIYRQSSSARAKNFIRATPIFLTSSGEISAEPTLGSAQHESFCGPCFEIDGKDTFKGILEGKTRERRACLIRRSDNGDLRFETPESGVQ
jgi:hypothetical protein